jgi:hypothetical protein
MGYETGDVAWLLREWRSATKVGGEYMTWRRLVGRYPGKSDLRWLWGLVATAVDDGYLSIPADAEPVPEPDSRISWDRWQLTDKGLALVAEPPQP